jgi:TorA maturation chaperone TorD
VRDLLRDRATRAAAPLLATVRVPALDAAFTTLAAHVARWAGQPPARVARALGGTYQRLFVGPYHLLAPPYESCYRGQDGRVMGEAAVAVRRHYAEAGFALASEVRDLPDHIALELLFLGLLAREEAALWHGGDREALVACLGREERFLVDHLGCWADALAERVCRARPSAFYRALTAATATYVAADLTLVGALREAVP